MSVGIHRLQNRTGVTAGSSDSDLKVGSLTDLNRYFQLTETHFPTLTGLDFFSFSTALRIFMLSSLVIVIVKSSSFIFSLVCFFVVLSLTKASPPAGCWLLRRLAASGDGGTITRNPVDCVPPRSAQRRRAFTFAADSAGRETTTRRRCSDAGSCVNDCKNKLPSIEDRGQTDRLRTAFSGCY